MRNGLLAALAALCIFPTTVFGQANWDNRDTTVSGDSGTTLRTFRNTMTCSGENKSWSPIAGNCYDGDPCTADRGWGTDPTLAYICCTWGNRCNAQGELLSEEELLALDSEREEEVADVFEPVQSTTFWGYAGTTVRSPNSGRTTAARAKLDACLFYSDVDTIDSLGGTDADKYGYCTQSTYGCASTMKNEYCQANSATVCIDRCACTYPNNGVDTCNNL